MEDSKKLLVLRVVFILVAIIPLFIPFKIRFVKGDEVYHDVFSGIIFIISSLENGSFLGAIIILLIYMLIPFTIYTGIKKSFFS